MRVIYQCEGDPAEDDDEYVVEGVDVKPGQVTIRVRPMRPPTPKGQLELQHLIHCGESLFEASSAPDHGGTLYLAREAYRQAYRAYRSAQ
jgi:hypothetical protein